MIAKTFTPKNPLKVFVIMGILSDGTTMPMPPGKQRVVPGLAQFSREKADARWTWSAVMLTPV
jgi:hypothetical protein